jgi:hypothetical protein
MNNAGWAEDEQEQPKKGGVAGDDDEDEGSPSGKWCTVS